MKTRADEDKQAKKAIGAISKKIKFDEIDDPLFKKKNIKKA